MEYKAENIRQLAEKYLRGETSLAEEAALRDYFNNCVEIPADLADCRLLFGQNAGASAVRSRRELKLHAGPVRKPLHRWMAAASGIAAAVLVTVFVTMDFNRSQADGNIVCYVNGHLITDRQAVMEYTQEALEIINAKLQEPVGYIAPKTENPSTMERINDMLDALTAETEEK